MIRKTKYCIAIFLMLAFSLPVLTSASTNSCDRLGNLKLPKTEIILSKLVPAGSFPDSAIKKIRYNMPEHCRVEGIAKPTEKSHINFVVLMPTKEWDGRFYQLGSGGFSGSLGFYGVDLPKGSAIAASDDGNQGGPGNDGSWALDQPDAIIDYGYRSIKETTIRSKAIIETYYSRQPKFSYFAGCSNGGRQALMAAQRFPEDWDGILAGTPSNYLTYTATMKIWNITAQWGEAGGNIPLEKLSVIQAGALAACSSEAHVINGVATDPRFCRYDPELLDCQSASEKSCLTISQAQALKKIYAGPIDPDTGHSIFPGIEPTFETMNWHYGLIREKPDTGPLYRLGAGFFRYMVFDDPQFDIFRIDFSDIEAQIDKKYVNGESLKSVLNAVDPDLRKLRDRGAKILMHHNWGDTYIPPQSSINYYHGVVSEMGGVGRVQDFFRLFMVPGASHCSGGGRGANAVGLFETLPAKHDDKRHNIFRALESWVEEGHAPDKIIATKYVEGNADKGIEFTRPLCPYPKLAIYDGHGPVENASSFRCEKGKAFSQTNQNK